MSTARAQQAAKALEHKGHSFLAPREGLWFIYKLLGSVISKSSTVKQWCCVPVLLPTLEAATKESPTLYSSISSWQEAAHLSHTLSASASGSQSSIHCKIKVMHYKHTPLKELCDKLHVLMSCIGLMPLLLTSPSQNYKCFPQCNFTKKISWHDLFLFWLFFSFIVFSSL